MNRVVAVALMLSCSVAAAQSQRVQPRPSDFAWHLPLTVSGDNGVVQFRLPLDVYARSQSAQLADVRVFDPGGQPVAFALHRPQPPAVPAVREQDVQQFPIRTHADAADGGVQLDVRANSDGTLLAIEAHSTPPAPGTPLTMLVIDTGPARDGETLEQLQFVLPDDVRDYRAQLRLEQSDDLKLWDALAQSSLDWIDASTGGERLVNDRIALSGATGRYLRIAWREGTPIEFARIAARWRSTTAAAAEPLQLVLDPQPGRQPGDWRYAASPAIAATQIGLELAQQNTVLPAAIGTYREQPRLQPAWRFDADVDATFYRLLRDGEERRSSAIATAPIAHAEWIVRAQNPGESAPKLVLRWQPETIVFNARGTGPFTLAFGAAPERMRDWTSSATTLARVAPGYAADELPTLEQAQAGTVSEAVAVENEATAATQARPAIEPRTLMLWGVLALGVLVLAGMCWKLFTQMSNDQTP